LRLLEFIDLVEANPLMVSQPVRRGWNVGLAVLACMHE
jgi:hypothetical protein